MDWTKGKMRMAVLDDPLIVLIAMRTKNAGASIPDAIF
jgi:hypothetical protein